MKGDFVFIKEVDNGFVIESHNYSGGAIPVKGTWIANNEKELHESIKRLYPIKGDETGSVPKNCSDGVG